MPSLQPDAQVQHDRALGYLLLRAGLGLNIFIHGATRLLAGPHKFAATLVPMFANTPLPAPSVVAFAYALPWLEAVIGLFVLFGIVTRNALLAGGLLMLALTFGSTLRQDWESAGLQLTYLLIYSALLAFRSHNTMSIDGLLSREHRSM